MPQPTLAFGIAGMPGSGKTLVASVAASLGYRVFSMGDVVRRLAQERDLEPTPEKLGELMLAIRSERGAAVVAEETIEVIRTAQVSRLCVEGIRSLPEVDLFRKEFSDFWTLATFSSPRTRFVRLTARERRDDPNSRTIFEERDQREVGVGLGGVLALADFMIVNEGSQAELESAAASAIRTIESYVQIRH